MSDLLDRIERAIKLHRTRHCTPGGLMYYKHEDQMMEDVLLDAAEALKSETKDASRYRWLSDQKPNSLTLTRNDHASNYVGAKEWIEDNGNDQFSDTPPEALEAMKQADTIWTLQVYPDTPVGFVWLHRDTLDALIDEAMADDAFTPQKEQP